MRSFAAYCHFLILGLPSFPEGEQNMFFAPSPLGQTIDSPPTMMGKLIRQNVYVHHAFSGSNLFQLHVQRRPRSPNWSRWPPGTPWGVRLARFQGRSRLSRKTRVSWRTRNARTSRVQRGERPRGTSWVTRSPWEKWSCWSPGSRGVARVTR